MSVDPGLLIIIAGAALAGFAQGLSGFAFSLVALSVWAWTVEPQLASPMAVFGALLGQLVALPFVWRGFSLRRLLPLLAGGLLGVPIGAIVLYGLDPLWFKLGLGIFLVIYCPLNLFFIKDIHIKRGGRAGDAVAGFFGGILGGITGAAGAIPTLWATMRGWNKEEQRGLLQGFNIAMHVTTLAVYFFAGTINSAALNMFAVIAPAIVLPAIAGVMLFNRLDVAAFRRMVLVLLFISGIVFLVGSIGAMLA